MKQKLKSYENKKILLVVECIMTVTMTRITIIFYEVMK